MMPTLTLSPEETNVRVAARVRPLLPREKAANFCNCVTVGPQSKQLIVGNRRAFAFDMAFDIDSTQEEIYNQCVAPLLAGCMQGYNATILAYGQTGSGKTHTLGTGHEAETTNCDKEGIAPKLVKQSFDHFGRHGNETDFKASCSYIEIYNEEIRDLLRPDAPKHLMAVRETVDGVIQVAGIHSEACNSAEQMLRCLNDGSRQRTTAATLMNEQSSRSHSILTIILEQRLRGQRHGAHEDGEATATNDSEDDEASNSASSKAKDAFACQPVYRTAKFHVVDLAGSERAKRTGAVGSRFRESVSINTGLLALGNVISALGDPAKRGFHVPYRESKLTRLLQDSLGGNSRTLMMACTSCADNDLEETLNTLKYAHRARNIKNKPVVNVDPKVAQLAAMQDEIEALRGELRRVSAGSDCTLSHPQLMLPLPAMARGTETDIGSVGLEQTTIEQVHAAERRREQTATHVASLEAESETLRKVLLNMCDAVHEHLPWICQGSFPHATTTQDLPQTARQALAAINVSLQEATSLLGNGDTTSHSGDGDEAVPPGFSDSLGEPLPASGDLEGNTADASDSANLGSFADIRRDSAPLIRRYLEEIKRLETELALQRCRNQQLQEELQETCVLVDKFFDEKIRENLALEDPNEALHAELQEAYAAARRRLHQKIPQIAASVVSERDSFAKVDPGTEMGHKEHDSTVRRFTASLVRRGSVQSAADSWEEGFEELEKGIGLANEEFFLCTPRTVASPCRARNRRSRGTPPNDCAIPCLEIRNGGEESTPVASVPSVTDCPASPPSRQHQTDSRGCGGQGTAGGGCDESPEDMAEVLDELRRLCDEAQSRAQSAEERANEEHLRAERILECVRELQPSQRRNETCGLCHVM
mmetsp:Transcript_72978/g.144613  ORF Transcript_72978/g.144613 Transcript_72978/m.144613 type:complete len:879 (-) Transcript_72978:196-2832(-)